MAKKNNGWWPIKDKLPEVSGKFDASEDVLCKPELGPQVVAWYTEGVGWRVSSHLASNDIIEVTHWRELPLDPK